MGRDGESGASGQDERYAAAAELYGPAIARIAPVSREMILNYIAERVLGLPKSY